MKENKRKEEEKGKEEGMNDQLSVLVDHIGQGSVEKQRHRNVEEDGEGEERLISTRLRLSPLRHLQWLLIEESWILGNQKVLLINFHCPRNCFQE